MNLIGEEVGVKSNVNTPSVTEAWQSVGATGQEV